MNILPAVIAVFMAAQTPQEVTPQQAQLEAIRAELTEMREIVHEQAKWEHRIGVDLIESDAA